MKQLVSGIMLFSVLFFSVSALSHNQVAVIPLTRCADGLTNCSGKCIDTNNNPNYCGNCTTDCGYGNYCGNGICKKDVGQSCTDDTECLTGKCTGSVCVDVKFVFVSSEKYSGNLGGLSGADSKCQALAQNAGLTGVYKAWLSDSTKSPSTRFNQSPLDYVLVGGSVIANGWSDLTDGTLDAPIDNNENGIYKTGHTWTNTNTNGASVSTDPTKSCNDWSSDSAGLTTTTGLATQSTSAWTSNLSILNCEAVSVNVGHLYCFEQ